MNIKNKICVGLDIDDPKNLYKIMGSIIHTQKYAFCYKINPAFFLGHQIILEKTISYLKENNLKWIYDGKLGDVNHTNEKYAEYIYEKLGAHGCTLNPYVGKEALKPFLQYKDKYNFLLCRTTNKGSELLQKESYKKVYKIAKETNSGLVIPGNKIEYLKDAVSNNPNTLILSPGIGSQGGKITLNNNNIIYNISRSIINSNNVEEQIKKYAL